MAGGQTMRRSGDSVLWRSVALGLAAVLLSGVSALGASQQREPAEVTPSQQAVPTSVRIAEALDADPEAIFRYVADEVRYEPYSGVLRGAAGTYYNRAGNSVDQALLLARLLEGADVTTRFAVGSIDEATQQALLASAVSGVDDIRGHADEAIAALIPGELPVEPPALSAEAQAIVDEALTTAADVDAWASEQLGGTLSTIATALADAELAVDGGFTSVPPSEVMQHTWIQAQVGEEWVDLDPSLPSAAYGEALTAADETLDAIPTDRFHSIELSVIAETLADGILSEEVLATASVPAHEAAGVPITIMNVGTDAIPALARGLQRVMGTITYSPIIVVGRDQYGGRPMSFTEPGGGGFFGPAPDAPETTAEWLELTVSSPGAEPVTVRRPMFDRVGVVARAAGNVHADALAPIETVDLGDGRTEELLPLQTAVWLSVSTGLPQRDAPVTQQESGNLGVGAASAFSQHMVAELAGIDYAVPLGVRPFVDAPNVTAFSWTLQPGFDGAPKNQFKTDIWHRSHGVAEVEDVQPEVPPAMVPGVISHLAERMVAGDGRPGEGAALSVSTGAVFDEMARTDAPFRVISDPREVADMPFSDEARQHLAASISDGRVAVVPESAVLLEGRDRVGWWLVDPPSGRVSDQLDDGRGSVIIEYAIQIDEALSMYQDLKCVFDKVIPLWQQAISHIQVLGTGGAAVYSAPAPDFLFECLPS